MMADIGNAYLNAKTEERVYTVAGPEFGDDKENCCYCPRVKRIKKFWRSRMASTFCFNTP